MVLPRFLPLALPLALFCGILMDEILRFLQIPTKHESSFHFGKTLSPRIDTLYTIEIVGEYQLLKLFKGFNAPN